MHNTNSSKIVSEQPGPTVFLLLQPHLHSKNVWNPRETEPSAHLSRRLLLVLVVVPTAVCHLQSVHLEGKTLREGTSPDGRGGHCEAGLRWEGAPGHRPRVRTDTLTVVLGSQGAAQGMQTTRGSHLELQSDGSTCTRLDIPVHPARPAHTPMESLELLVGCGAPCRVCTESHNNQVTVASPDEIAPLCKQGSGGFLFVLGSIQNYNWPSSY